MQAINVCTPGHMDIYDSYGLIACQLVRHLDRLGVYVNAIPLGDRQMDNQPPDIARIAGQPLRAAFGGLFLGYPTAYHKYTPLAQYGPRVAVTMFESTVLPPDWTDILNTLDAVVVPSQFCHDTFRKNGVTVPIHVVPLGLSEVYQPDKRPEQEPFTFLSFLDRGRRKGGLAALQAFVKEFGEDSAYRLILKSRDTKVALNIVNPNIKLIQQDMTEEEMYRLYLSADVMVNPNMGEGFGLIPREFAATGGLALATGWGGTVDDIEEWGLPIPYELVDADWSGAKNLEMYELGQWAQPDVPALARLMRVVADSRDEWRELAYARAERVREMYRWDRFVEEVYDIWQHAGKEQVSGYAYATV